MASGIFALLDDIAMLMDDVAVMGKMAAKKTIGILGDDLAVTAEKSSGFVSSRELPILWKLTKGSLINKLLVLPGAFLLSAFLPIAVTILLVIGGVYLSYEGAEKIMEYLFHRKRGGDNFKTPVETEENRQIKETKKVKSALFVDLILSIEIVIIALSTVIENSILVQILVVSGVALVATVGVYGIVALLVRMDDLGYLLIEKSDNSKTFSARIGMILVEALPIIIRLLTVIGTLAMLLVAGGIFRHTFHELHHLFYGLPLILGDFITGFVVGISVFLVLKLGVLVFSKIKTRM
jgi:uncharacterized protein